MTPNTSEKVSSPRSIVYLDLLKLAAAFCVVHIHVLCLRIYNFGMPPSDWFWLNVSDSLCRFCIPIFFMASGVVFLSAERAFHLKTFLQKNVLRLCVVYGIWCLVYHAFDLLVAKGQPVSAVVYDVLHLNFIPASYHLWFLPAMVGAYLCVPFLRVVCEKERNHRLCAGAVVALVFVPVFLEGFPVLNTVTTILRDFLPVRALYPAAYMVLGSYLHRTSLQRRQRMLLYAGGALSVLAIIVLTQRIYPMISYYPGCIFAFYNYDGLLVCLMACALFVLAKQLAEKCPCTCRTRLLRSLVKHTFASYLVHVMIISLLGEKLLSALPLPMALSMLVVSVAVFAISMGISWVLNRIPLVNRYLI